MSLPIKRRQRTRALFLLLALLAPGPVRPDAPTPPPTGNAAPTNPPPAQTPSPAPPSPTPATGAPKATPPPAKPSSLGGLFDLLGAGGTEKPPTDKPSAENTTLEMAPPEDGGPILNFVRATTHLTYQTQSQHGRDTGVPLVRVRLNNSVSATFLLDTGTSVCMVTDTMAAKLGLTPQPTHVPAAAQVMDGATATAVPLTIALGGFSFRRYPALVIKESRLTQVLGAAPDGILGADLLAHFAVGLRPRDHALTLIYPGRLAADDTHAMGLDHPAALALTVGQGGVYAVPLGFQNGDKLGRCDLLIDTGAVTTIVPHDLAAHLALAPTKTALPTDFGNGTFNADLARVPLLLLGAQSGDGGQPGQLALENGLVLFPHDPETTPGSAPHVLGMNILSACDILLDFPGKTLYLQPLAPKTGDTPKDAQQPTLTKQ